MVCRMQTEYVKGSLLLVALACVSGLLASSPALAQISGLPSIPGIAPLPTAPESPAEMKGVQGPTGVLERVRPEVEAVPFTVKGIDLYPSMFEAGTFDSNIFAAQSNAVADFLLRSRPDLHGDNGPGPSAVVAAFDIYAEDDRYVGHGYLSNDNAGATVNLGDEFEQGFTGTSRTAYVYQHQDPASLTIQTPGVSLRSLPALSTFSEDAGINREFAEWALALDGGYTRQDYQNVTLTNGTVENQTQLNGNTYRIGPKFTYDFAPDLRPFVQSSYARFAFDDNAFSANEYSGVVGADFDLRQLVRGTAFAGYKTHSYDSSSIPTDYGPTFGLNVTWFATEVLTLNATGSQTFSDLTVRSTSGIHSAIDTKDLAAEADYEALRNLIVSGIASYENDSYHSVSRNDNIYSVELVARYLVDQNWTALAQYQFATKELSLGSFNYDRNTISVGLKLAF